MLHTMHATLERRGEALDAQGRGMGQVWAMRRWAEGVEAQAALWNSTFPASDNLSGFAP